MHIILTCFALSLISPLLMALGICVLMKVHHHPLETLLAKLSKLLILEEKSGFNLDATVLGESPPRSSW